MKERELHDWERGNMSDSALQLLSSTELTVGVFPRLITRIIEVQAWKDQVFRGTPVSFKSLAEMIKKPVSECGWGTTLEFVETLIKHDPEALTRFRQAITPSPGGDKKSETYQESKINTDNISNEKKEPHGTSKAYTLDRLSRVDPDLFRAVCDGQMSVNQAAIQAGIRKVPTLLEAAIKSYNKLDEAQRAEFWELIK